MWTLGAYLVVFVVPILCTLFTVVYYLMGPKPRKKGG